VTLWLVVNFNLLREALKPVGAALVEELVGQIARGGVGVLKQAVRVVADFVVEREAAEQHLAAR
jgi:hypothetical protein